MDMTAKLCKRLEVDDWGLSMAQKTQRTGKGHDIPVPKRGDFFSNLKMRAELARWIGRP